MVKKLLCTLVAGMAISLIGCPPPSGDKTPAPSTDTSKPADTGTAAPTGDTGTKPADTGSAAPAAPAVTSPDLKHVKAGQKYTFEMQNNMQQVWTVKEVGADFVKYEMAMIMGGNPLGEPTVQEWKYTAPPATTATAEAPKTDVKMSREKVKIGDIEFDCMVSEASGYKSWMTMTPGSDTIWTFPGAIKTVQLSDNAVINELKKIE